MVLPPVTSSRVMRVVHDWTTMKLAGLKPVRTTPAKRSRDPSTDGARGDAARQRTSAKM